jgi:hypothetical protein
MIKAILFTAFYAASVGFTALTILVGVFVAVKEYKYPRLRPEPEAASGAVVVKYDKNAVANATLACLWATDFMEKAANRAIETGEVSVSEEMLIRELLQAADDAFPNNPVAHQTFLEAAFYEVKFLGSELMLICNGHEFAAEHEAEIRRLFEKRRALLLQK